MSKNLSTEQATARNAESFSKQLSILNQAAVGVILVRTREPFRAIETIHTFASSERLSYKVWTISRGWADYKSDPEVEPTTDNVVDPLAALRKIGSDNQLKAVYVMMYPHKPLSQNIGMIQTIKEYCRLFPETKKRLILVTPQTWEIPQELEDDLSILDFDAPSYAELDMTLDDIIQGMKVERRPQFSATDKDRILAAGAGMVAHEFENAVSRAMVTLRDQLPNVSVDEFVAIVMNVKTEIVRRSEVLEIMEPADIANIGGLDNLKAWIGKRARCFSQEAKDYGIEAPKGIALIGPPGTGKSASAKAISSVLGIPGIRFDVSRVFAGLVGQSEARVRAALKLVDAMAPCVLMIDEADKAFAGQANGSGGGDSGVGMRVLGTILTWMQETKSPVFLVVTANRVTGLPSEFLRKGRLDEVFSVSVPNEDERLAIAKIHLRIRGHDPEAVGGLEEVVIASAGYVPAEIEAAVKDGLIEAYTENRPITGTVIAEELRKTTPLSIAHKEQFDDMRLWAESNARPASLAPGQVVERPRVRERTAPGLASKAGPRMVSLDG